MWSCIIANFKEKKRAPRVASYRSCDVSRHHVVIMEFRLVLSGLTCRVQWTPDSSLPDPKHAGYSVFGGWIWLPVNVFETYRSRQLECQLCQRQTQANDHNRMVLWLKADCERITIESSRRRFTTWKKWKVKTSTRGVSRSRSGKTLSNKVLKVRENEQEIGLCEVGKGLNLPKGEW